MSKEVFTHEKVRELAMELREKTIPSGYERAITKWLEQNQPEPKVVGLSDEQKKGLGEYIYAHTEYDADYKWLIDVYLSKQTFVQHDRFLESQFNDVMAQLEQLKSQQDITDGGWRGKYDRLHVDYNLLLAELKEYRIREIPMLDEQCKFKDQFDNLNMELELLKSQQFTPDWSRIPADATIDGCKIDLVWTCCGGLIERETLATYERPKPTPCVELGQVWKCAKNQQDYTVTEIATLEGETKVNDGAWEKDMQLIAYRPVKACEVKIYHRTLSDFLAKFNRVGVDL